jgi:hypothetical protein
MESFLLMIHVDPADAFAAFTGGVCAALATQGARPTLLGVISSIAVGTGVGSYGGPVLPLYVHMKPNGFMTMLIGFSGLPILLLGRSWFTKALKIRLSIAGKKLETGE